MTFVRWLMVLGLLMGLCSCVVQLPTRNGIQVIGAEWIWDCPESPLCPAWLAR